MPRKLLLMRLEVRVVMGVLHVNKFVWVGNHVVIAGSAVNVVPDAMVRMYYSVGREKGGESFIDILLD